MTNEEWRKLLRYAKENNSFYKFKWAVQHFIYRGTTNITMEHFIKANYYECVKVWFLDYYKGNKR